MVYEEDEGGGGHGFGEEVGADPAPEPVFEFGDGGGGRMRGEEEEERAVPCWPDGDSRVFFDGGYGAVGWHCTPDIRSLLGRWWYRVILLLLVGRLGGI